jgi:3',5'-cyclic-AMP phosphodiesterase
MTFRIAQISDTHLSDEKPFFVDNFMRIGEALRADRPDLVLNSGDIALDGASTESDLAAARVLHDGLDLPLRFLPGNHDIGDCQDAPSHGEGTIDPGRRARYVAHFGNDWWTLDVPGRFVNPVPRRSLFAALDGVVPALVACGHVHQYRNTETDGTRHVWGTSTAFVLPDRLQPRYGTKEVGYVEHRLEPDGRHDSRLVQVPGVPTLNIADFPGAYGPL